MENPLVSICLTFFSAERFIHRVIESSLNQTYRNIEIVIVDNASIDKSRKVIEEYQVKDKRVKYFRNEKKADLTTCFLKMFELAHGDFVVMLGADDWLARHAVEKGVKIFNDNPEVAGIIPKIINFYEIEHDKFEFDRVLNLPSSKIYLVEWLAKRMYKGQLQLYMSAYALMRKEDAVSAVRFFIKNCCENPLIPEELKKLFWGGYNLDPMFLEVISRYKSFVFDDSMVFIKIAHPGNIFRDFRYDSVSEIFRYSYYLMLSYMPLYKLEWSKVYRGMKIFSGTEALATVFINSFKYRFRRSFFDFSKAKNLIVKFFSDFLFFEIIMVVILSIPRVAYRLFDLSRRRILKNRKFSKNGGHDLSTIFSEENFFDSRKHFRISENKK